MKIKRIYRYCIIPILLLLSACYSNFISAENLQWDQEDPILFRDDFSSPKSGWVTNEESRSYSGYALEGFQFRSEIPNFQFWSVPGLNFKDVHIYTKARKIGGPDDNLFGLICRYQDPLNFYAFIIGSDGYYGIFKVLEGHQALINQVHLDFSEVINQGNSENEIHVLCEGENLVLIVNDSQLLFVQDASLAYGDVGLIAGNFSEPGVNVLFDNFIVMKP